MKLLGNRVHLQLLPPTLQSAGGIHYAQSFQDDKMQFRVLAVGSGRKLKNGTVLPIEVQPGDYVLAPLYHEHTILPDGSRIVDAKELIAVWPSRSSN